MSTVAVPRLPAWGAGLVASLAGALSVLGFAPFHLWPLNAIALVVLVALFDDATHTGHPRRAGFWRGWAFGFGAFVAGLNWIANAFFVDADKFGALAIPAVVALPAGLALFWGAAGALALQLWTHDVRRIFVFAACIGLFETLRSTVLTGFPWNLPGHVWHAGGIVSQMAAHIGLDGLSMLTLLVFASPAIWFGAASQRTKLLVSGGALCLLVGMAGYGQWRLINASTTAAANTPIIAVADAGFSQREKWLPENRNKVAAKYLDQLDDPAIRNADVIVWPEGAVPFPLLEDAVVLAGIDARLGTRALAAGIVRRDFNGPGQEEYFNSLITISRDETGLSLRSLYDKNHLVPFGEYVPFGAVFDALGLRSLVSYGVDFSPGPPPRALSVPGAPLAWPLICYEAIFPFLPPEGAERPSWLLNVSVDAWFGQAQGPAQHFNQARYRAIETGLPLVRAASGGPSGITDAYGRIVAQLPPGGGVVAAPLPPALPSPLQLGNFSFQWLLIAAYFGVRLFRIVSRRSHGTP